MEFQGSRHTILCLSFVAFFCFLGHLCAELEKNDTPSNIVEDNQVHVGVILDLGSREGKIIHSCITTALTDFYDVYDNYSTRVVLHTRDSKGKPLHALSAGLNLLDNSHVEAIISGQTRLEAALLAELGEEAKIPVMSLSEPSTSNKYPFLVEITKDETSQVMGISALIEMFKWRDVILVYENMEYGSDIIPSLISSFQEKHVFIANKSSLAASSTDEEIIDVLQTLKILKTTVFVVHISHLLVPRLFSNANKLGMMSEGYAWIVTSTSMNFLHSMDISVIESMQGVLGLKSYIPASMNLNSLTSRLRRKFYLEEPNIEVREVNADGIWAYDATWALAEAVERAMINNSTTTKPDIKPNLMDLNIIKPSKHGVGILGEILETRFKGLSGEIHYPDGKLKSGAFEIGNVIGKGDRRVGFLAFDDNKIKLSDPLGNRRNMLSKEVLATIIWPGGSTTITNGSRMQVRRNIKVGVPMTVAFHPLVRIERNNLTHINVTGFCIEVFKAAVSALPVDYEFIPFEGSYGQLIDQVYLKELDAAAGDITITSNRSSYVEFTIPFSDLGLAMLVPNGESRDMWIFMKPFSGGLWLTSAAFFVLTGFVVWVIEHPLNQEFQGTLWQQIGTLLWFSFSTIVFAHREKLVNNSAKFVVIIWVFVVLILNSSYTATLASMMTIKQIQLNPEGYVGSHSLISLINTLAKENMNFSGFKPYDSEEQMHRALSRGSKNGGVSAIIDEIPYIKVFLAKYSNGYSMIKRNSTTNGFGFVFPKGSQLVHDMSKQIETLREEGKLLQIEKKWFDVPEDTTSDPDPNNTLSLKRFRGLFLICGVSSVSALFLFLIFSLKDKWHVVKKCILTYQIRGNLHNVRMMFLSNKISYGNEQIPSTQMATL